MLAQRCSLQQLPRTHRVHPDPAALSKMWPAQQQHRVHHCCSRRIQCRSNAPNEPPPDSTAGISSSTSSSSSGVTPPQQQQQQGNKEQQLPSPLETSPAQQQQQQQPKGAKTTSSSSTSKAKSSSKSQQQPRRKAPQRPFFLFAWLQAAVAAVRRMPTTLTTFLLGGLFSAFLLYSWALGSPLKRSHPYRFTMVFNEASKVDTGTPVRMKGVQIGTVVAARLQGSHVDVTAEVADAANIIPQGSRVDINLLGIAADPWIDITPPANAVVRRDHGPHHPACAAEGLIVCHHGSIRGQLGGSTDFMMKFFLSQHDRTRVKSVDTLYHGRSA